MAKKKKSKKRKSKKSKSKIEHHFIRLPKIYKISFWLPCLFFFLFAFGLYYKCLNYDFILDDKIVITHNNFTKKGIEGIYKEEVMHLAHGDKWVKILSKDPEQKKFLQERLNLWWPRVMNVFGN